MDGWAEQLLTENYQGGLFHKYFFAKKIAFYNPKLFMFKAKIIDILNENLGILIAT